MFARFAEHSLLNQQHTLIPKIMTPEQQLTLLSDLVPVCDKGDAREISEIMDRHFYSLRGARSLFCVEDAKYHRGVLPESRTFGSTGYLHGFMKNRQILNIKNSGEGTDFFYTYTISCDTQFPSFLRRRVQGRAITGLDDAITECLRFLAKHRSGLDLQLYAFENQDRIDSVEVEETISAYLTFIQAQEKPLTERGEIVSSLSPADLHKRTRDIMDMLQGRDWKVVAGYAKRNWAVSYVLLLLAATIHLKYRNRSSSYRLARLIEGVDDVGFFPKIEIHLVHRFFEKGNQEKFFRGIQENGSGLKNKLSNMAWDLSHKRNIFNGVLSQALGNKQHADFVVPYMLTFDAPLGVLLKDYQINGLIAYLDEGAKFLEIYPMRIEAAIAEGFEIVEHLLEPQRKYERLQRGLDFYNDEQCRAQIITRLELELDNIIAHQN